MGDLYQSLKKYGEEKVCPMHMPGHKRNTKLLGEELPYKIDITEIENFDDLHHPEGKIKKIQEKAQKVYGSKNSFLLVNGSTCGILAGIRSIVKPGGNILVARNCHKSVEHAIEINNLNPIYIVPQIDEYGIDEDISVSQIEEQLKIHQNLELIVITSPTYEGVISNLPEIVKVAHNHNVPVLVDEAHGAHLSFIQELKRYEAINSGADIVIQSLHKTLPALTQCAIAHVQGNIVNPKEMARQLSIFQTSSPSYILMASIEECLDIIENKGCELFDKYNGNLEQFYKETRNLKNLKLLGNETSQIFDKGKIVILTNTCNLTGKELAQVLRKEYNIETEMANINYVIAMTSICDEKQNFQRLRDALIEIDTRVETKDLDTVNKVVDLPERKISTQQAMYASGEYVNIKEAEGKISKEYIWIYPPGIPLIVPGEVINKQIINELHKIQSSGIEIRTSNNKFPEIMIVK